MVNTCVKLFKVSPVIQMSFKKKTYRKAGDERRTARLSSIPFIIHTEITHSTVPINEFLASYAHDWQKGC